MSKMSLIGAKRYTARSHTAVHGNQEGNLEQGNAWPPTQRVPIWIYLTCNSEIYRFIVLVNTPTELLTCHSPIPTA